MLLICIVIALALFMYGLPACLDRAGQVDDTLFGRIEQEQKARLDQSFHQRKTRWQLVRLLENNNQLLDRLCKLTGIDRQKTTEILSRLGWRVRLAEIIHTAKKSV